MGSVPASAIDQDALADARAAHEQQGDERALTDLVEQPAKVMRIGSMIRQLLEEVKAAPLDEASRNRLKEIHRASIKELEAGPGPGAGRGARAADAAVHRGGHAVGGRAADRPGPAGRLARGPLPRHPDRDLRPADGGAGAVRADPPRAARRASAAQPAVDETAGRGRAAPARRVRRDVPLSGPVRQCRASRRTTTRPSRPTSTSATPGRGQAGARSPAGCRRPG